MGAAAFNLYLIIIVNFHFPKTHVDVWELFKGVLMAIFERVTIALFIA